MPWYLVRLLMRRNRRATAVLVGLLLANLTWVGSGYACMPAMNDALPAAETSSAMGGMADMNNSQAASLSHGPDRDGAPRQDAPCRLPWVPDGCQSMTPCAPLAIASHALEVGVPNVAPLGVDELTALMPPSELRKPDPPPPRV